MIQSGLIEEPGSLTTYMNTSGRDVGSESTGPL
jgi:hypothetical protein